MTLRLLFILLCYVPVQANAALPPQVQNLKDLNVMVDFARQHPRILSSLESIDLEGYKIYYRQGCVASFKRKGSLLSVKMPGPAGPLVFNKSTCPID